MLAEEGRGSGEIDVTVMKKERLTFRFDDERLATEWKDQIDETRFFGLSRTSLLLPRTRLNPR